MTINFAKDIHVVGEKMARNGCKKVVSILSYQSLMLYIMHRSDWPNRLLYAVAVLPIFWHYSSFPVLSLSWTLDAARNDHTPKCQDLFTKTVVELSTTTQSPSLSAPGRPDIFLGSETQKKRPVKKKVQDMGFKK